MITRTIASVLADSKVMVRHAAAVYDGTPDIVSVVRDTQVNVRVDTTSAGASVVVAFRGTCDAQGWREDADVSRQAIATSLVHRGFMANVLSVLGDVTNKLDMHIGVPVFVTGHSKGGAEAMLLAWALKQRGYCQADGLFTFGQPRVGDAQFAAQYDRWLGDRSFRFTHGSDLVPWIPFLCGRYRHAGHEIFMPVGDVLGAVTSANYKVDPTMLYKLACDGRETWRALRAAKHGEPPQTADHHINTYVQQVEALVA